MEIGYITFWTSWLPTYPYLSNLYILIFQIECNSHGLNADWHTQQVYPYPPDRSVIAYKINIDKNGVTSLSLNPPHPDEIGDEYDYTFARFEPEELNVTTEFPELETPHYSVSKEVVKKRLGGPGRGHKTRPMRQRQYRPKRARRRQQPVYVEEKPKKLKVKKSAESPEERRELKAVARRMRNWQNKKFLFE